MGIIGHIVQNVAPTKKTWIRGGSTIIGGTVVMVVCQAVVKGYGRVGVRAECACAAKRARTGVAGSMTSRRMGVGLNAGWNRYILRRLSVCDDDQVALAVVDILCGRSPLGRGEIVWMSGLHCGRTVSH